MMDVRVHPAVAQQPQEMQLPLPPALHRLPEQRHVLELLVGDHQIDPRNVHMHNASRAHVHVPHFAVAHLPFGQAHERPGSLNQRVRKFAKQFVVSRFARERDRVSFRLRAVPPSIEHGQYQGLRSFCHSEPEYRSSPRTVIPRGSQGSQALHG